MSSQKLFYPNEVYIPKSSDLSDISSKELKHGKWSEEEDEKLTFLVKKYDFKNWRLVSEEMNNRSPIQCLHRWTKILQPGLVKGPWTAEEDAKLLEWVKKEGPVKWPSCAKNIPGRTGKQCREHWIYSLNPSVKKGEWDEEEDFKIIFFYKKFKGGWKNIAPFFSGRTANSIKNRFYCQLRKIASEKLNIKGKNDTSKIKLSTLLNYIDEAYDLLAQNFRKKTKMSIEDFNDYVIALSKTDKSKDSTNETTKDISSTCSIGSEKKESFDQFDLEFLEKEICEQCDNNQFFFDQDAERFENQLDKEIDKIFLKKINNGEIFMDESKCDNCQPPLTKEENYKQLLSKLMDLQNQVQKTKQELLKYEKDLDIDQEEINFNKEKNN